MSFDARNITQGGQVIKYMIGMFIQITNIIVYYSVMPALATFFGYMVFTMKWVHIKHGLTYLFIREQVRLFNKTDLNQIHQFSWVTEAGETVNFTRTNGQILNDTYFIKCFEQLKEHAFIGWGLAISVFIVIICLAMWYLGRRGRLQRQDDILGGRTLAKSIKGVNFLLRKQNKLSHLKIGDLHLVKNSEIQNIGLHGTVGTGKSTVINSLLEQGRTDDNRGVIYDKGNNFIPLFYREGKDIILNPMDDRCPNWDLWEECKDIADLQNFATPLLPDSKGGGDPFWILSARMLFVHTAEAMRSDPHRSIKKLLNHLLAISLNDLKETLSGTDAVNLVDGSIEKTAITIRTVLAAYAKSLRLCQGLDAKGGKKFSIRTWLNSSDADAWIFLSSDGRIHESVKPLITAWLNVIMQNVLALKPDLKRRVWTVLDELNSLYKVPLILEYLSEARKFGGATLVGLQSFPQLENTYGKDEARAIWDLLNTKAFFRAPSGDVARWVQSELGEVRHKKFQDQYSYGIDTIRDGVNFSKDEKDEYIVNYSDIQRLNDLQCYVSLLGDLPIVKVNLKRKEFPKIAEAKVERDMSAVFDSHLEQLIKDADQQNSIQKLAKKVVGTNEEASGTEVIEPKPPKFNPDGTLAEDEEYQESKKQSDIENSIHSENGQVGNNLKRVQLQEKRVIVTDLEL